MSTIFHSHSPKISTFSKVRYNLAKCIVLPYVKQPNCILGEHWTLVENHIETTWCCILEKDFDFSSYEDDIGISKSTKWNFPNGWLVKSWRKKSSLHFELVRTTLASMDCKISTKMLIKIKFFYFATFCIGALNLWSKFLFKFTFFTIHKGALEIIFDLHGANQAIARPTAIIAT